MYWIKQAVLGAAILVAAAGCARLFESPPRVYRLAPNEGLVLYEKDSILCVGTTCERLWK
jgi:hypothetical protein